MRRYVVGHCEAISSHESNFNKLLVRQGIRTGLSHAESADDALRSLKLALCVSHGDVKQARLGGIELGLCSVQTAFISLLLSKVVR